MLSIFTFVWRFCCMHTTKNAGYQYSHSIVFNTRWKWWLWKENCNAERNIFLASSIEILLLTCVKNFRDDATNKEKISQASRKTIFQRKRKLYCTNYTNERSLFLVNENEASRMLPRICESERKLESFRFLPICHESSFPSLWRSFMFSSLTHPKN